MITKLMTLYKDYNKDLTSTGSKIYRDRHRKLSKNTKKFYNIFTSCISNKYQIHFSQYDKEFRGT